MGTIPGTPPIPFTFLYEQKADDFDVRAQVINVQVDDPAEQDSGKGAIMARANLTPGSPNVQVNALGANARNQVETIYRPAQDIGTDDMPDKPTSNTQPLLKPYPDVWLRMKRTGNSFTTYRGDGIQWQVTWSGGNAPYQLQKRATFSGGNWTNEGAQSTATSATVPITGNEGYFRVQGQ